MDEVRERTSRCSSRAELDRHRRPAAARRLRLRDAARPRAPAQRDDAAAAADGRRLRPARVDGTVAGEPVARRAARWSGSTAASYEVGADAAGFAYDNERPRHAVELEAFEIDRTPVTNGAFAEFVADTGAEPPLYWERDGDGWVTTTFGSPTRARPRPPGRPRQLATRREAFAALGRQAAADRVRVGGGVERRRSGARQPRPARLRLRAGRRLRGRRLGLRRGADAGRRLGVDFLRLRRLSRLPGLPVPRVLGGLLRRRATRCCAAAPGRPAAT